MKRSLLLLLLMSSLSVVAAPASATYFCDFEDEEENSEWITWKGSNLLSETWKTGRQLHFTGTHGMYTSDLSIDSVGNNTHSWVKNSGYTVSTYRKMSLTAGTYEVSLDYLAPEGVIAVALVQADTLTGLQIKTLTGADYAAIIKTANIANLTDLKSLSWAHKSGSVTLTGAATDYLLVVTYRSQGGDYSIGAAVDNIEVVKKQSDRTACDYAIQNLSQELVSGYVQLTWKGNAGKYEVRYFNSDTLLVTMDTVLASTTSDVDTCLIPVGNMTNGVYSFMVRTADCETQSAWAYVRNKLIYDPSSHCIDFLNFDARGVQCSYGSGTWHGTTETLSPGTVGYLDEGSASRYSSHTLHFNPQEFDPMTVGQTRLRTVPEGHFASVRLGGKEPNHLEPGSRYQRVEYTIHVDSTMGVVLFRYAYIGQTGGHGSGDLTQPHLRLKLTDQNGQIINGADCGSILFTAPNDDADMARLNMDPRTAGWHKGALDDGDGSVCSDYVYWRDWTTVGINVQQYIDQDIHIQITNFGCGDFCHYGYAYFVLDCSSGKLGGVTCGEKPREMVADEGFLYRWYKPFNPDEPFYEGQDPSQQVLYVSPNDSNTYFVDLMTKSNQSCYFTLHASAMARLPKAIAELRHAPKECVNYVDVTNKSGLFGFFTNSETGQPDSTEIEGGLAHQYWTVRTASGMTAFEGADTSRIEPIMVPNEGDTVWIDLKVEMEEGCEDEQHFEFVVPAIGPNSHIDSLILCQGQSIEYEGHTYTEAGDFPLMTEKNWAGCDSTRTLHIDYEFSYIFQRWGDVLSVKKNANPETDDSTHYDFVGFQWLRNGEPIEGATNSYYYVGEGNILSPNDVYRVLLTHPDGTTELSCDYTPFEYQSPVQVAPRRLRASELIQVSCPYDAVATYYNTLGMYIGEAVIKEGENSIAAPSQSGIYLMTISDRSQQAEKRRRETFRISVY